MKDTKYHDSLFFAPSKIAMLLRRHAFSRRAKIIAITALFTILVNTMAFSRTFLNIGRKNIGTRQPFLQSELNVLNTPSPSPSSVRNGSSPIKIEKSMFGSTSTSTSSSTSASTSTSTSTSSSHSKSQNHPDAKIIRPLVVCGPSGVGKGTIIGKYMSEYGGDDKFAFTVSHTTRKPRPGEVDGIHYHFTDAPSIKAAIQRNEFLEYAEVHGNLYGTSIKSLSFVQDTEQKLPILDIDIQGVKSIKAWQSEQDPLSSSSSVEVGGDNDENSSRFELDAKFIFIAPPSLDVLKERLIARGTETAESLERRTKNAHAEMEYGMERGNFDAIVINDDLDKACQSFSDAIDRLYES